jgi:hypothetical protein
MSKKLQIEIKLRTKRGNGGWCSETISYLKLRLDAI